MITRKALKLTLLERLRLDIYLNCYNRNRNYNIQYAQGREDTTRNHLVLLGFEKDKLMTVKDIDELLGVGK